MDATTDSPARGGTPDVALERLTSAVGADGVGLRSVLLYSLLGGLCPLIPLPFLDDVLVRSIRRRMVRSLLRRAGHDATEAQARRLTRTERRGLLLGCLVGVVWYAIRKISRKILYFLAVKDCVDVASRLLHEGWLLQYALSRGVLPAGALRDEDLDRVRDAIERACERVDTRPLEQLLRRLFDAQMVLLTRLADGLGRLLRAEGASRRDRDAVERALQRGEGREVGALERLLDDLARGLGAHEPYLRALEAAFDGEVQGEAGGEAIPGEGAG